MEDGSASELEELLYLLKKSLIQEDLEEADELEEEIGQLMDEVL